MATARPKPALALASLAVSSVSSVPPPTATTGAPARSPLAHARADSAVPETVATQYVAAAPAVAAASV